MPNWKEVIEEVAKVNMQGNQALDVVRRKYLKQIFLYTKRNVIAYYSGWLQRPNSPDVIVNDKDISGFMLNIHKMDRTKGLDLILHTPGGSLVAAEALVTYLKSMFGKNIRAIVPQLSMSAGTMIAFSCKEMGLNIVELESDNKLQDLVLTTHHAFMHTFSNSGALKIIENQNGVAFIEHLPYKQTN